MRLIRAGDREAAGVLVERFTPAVFAAIRKLEVPPWCEFDDLAQVGRLAILEVARGKWKADGKAKFHTFLTPKIRWRIQNAIRQERPKYETAEDAPGSTIPVPTTDGGRERLMALLGLLDPLDRAVVECSFGLHGAEVGRDRPALVRDVAESLGLTPHRFRVILKRAMANLRVAARPAESHNGA